MHLDNINRKVSDNVECYSQLTCVNTYMTNSTVPTKGG